MHKILLAILLFIVFFFPKSEVLAEVSCTTDKSSNLIRPNETFTFTATGLEKNTNYQLSLNAQPYGGSVKSTNLGDIIITVNPESTGVQYSGVINVWLKKFPGAYVCQNIILTVDTKDPDTGEDLGAAKRLLQTRYRCNKEKKACEVAVDLRGNPSLIGTTTDQASCNIVCNAEGKTFSGVKNELIQSTSGGGQPCNLDGGQPHKLKPGEAVPENSGIYTAIGCIPTEPKALVEGVLKFATLAAGGIAFLLMILGALGLITAEGNPEAIKNSQERFYSAIVGLLLIIFSVLLMQVIGVDILGLPGFER